MANSMTWPLEYWSPQAWGALKICEHCLTEAKTLHATARQTFWEQLPEMFGLPGWVELEEMQRVALLV
ncbi:hypothetical protein B0H19DRAFT_1117472 [Mycena capillaripes]|nr:hypothetical protein B0H19DRAFT_1117472 [Mycena capillaripes]